MSGESVTETPTVTSAVGGGYACTVKTAFPPSSTAAPPVIHTQLSQGATPLSKTTTAAVDGLPVATPAGTVSMETVKVSSTSFVVSIAVWTVKLCEAALAGTVTLDGQPL